MTEDEILAVIRNNIGNAIITWCDMTQSQATFGRFRNGNPWMVCANWTGIEGQMKVHSPYDFVDQIHAVEFK